MLKNIIFDCGGVICEYVVQDILDRYFDRADQPIVQPVLYRDWNGLDAGTRNYWEYAHESEDLVPERLKEKVRFFFQDWFRTQPPIEGTWALAARLKARGYGVYLLSNAPTVYADYIAEIFPILKMFDGLVISAPIHKIKPNADIFEYILQKYGLIAEECLFVDDMETNVKGAIACGMQGYHYHADAEKLLKAIEAQEEK